MSQKKNNLHTTQMAQRSALKRDSESAWDPGTNSNQICFNEQSEKIVALGSTDYGTHGLHGTIFSMKGARRINEPTVDPSPFQTAPFIYQLNHAALLFGDWALGLRTQNSLSPRYLGCKKKWTAGFHVPKRRSFVTHDPFFC